MGWISATVSFSANLPTPAALVAVLCQCTGEVVKYDVEVYALSCAASEEFAFAILDLQGNTWQVESLLGNYLWEAALSVLQELGGFYPSALPDWAGKPWQQVKQHYQYPMPKPPPYEARRLGVE